jgi:hypothetical protein
VLKEQIESALRMILARAEVFNCQLNHDLDIAHRRPARPPRLPYIASGQPEKVPWRPWEIGAGPDKTRIGLRATIDTTAAGFLTTPCYSMRIEGPRTLEVEKDHFVVVPVAVIQDSKPDGFSINVSPLPVPIQPSGLQIIPMVLMAQPVMLSIMPNVEMAGAPAEGAEVADRVAILQQVIDWAIANWNVVWLGVEE